MTLGGWATFILSVGSFTALFAWCLYKVLFSESAKGEKLPEQPEPAGGKSGSSTGARRCGCRK